MIRGLTIAGGAVALATLLLAGCATGKVAFLNATPGAPIRITAALHRPSGPGPFSAVVIMHGCEGVVPMHTTWARRLKGEGYVALIVDSLTPRGFVELCSAGGPDVKTTDRMDDAIGALRHLQGLSFVDGARIGALGFSHGGTYAIAVINGPSLERARARGVALPSPGYAAGVAVYPGGCRSLVNELVVKPLLVLIGDADDWTPADVCQQMVEAMRSRGAPAEIVLYSGAYHYFDVEGQKREFLADVENPNSPNGCCGATVAYDAAAAADARQRVPRFFERHLKR
jgi:dienelactone hydrolase